MSNNPAMYKIIELESISRLQDELNQSEKEDWVVVGLVSRNDGWITCVLQKMDVYHKRILQ